MRIPKSEFHGPAFIGGHPIMCHVLSDRQRVIEEDDFIDSRDATRTLVQLVDSEEEDMAAIRKQARRVLMQLVGTGLQQMGDMRREDRD